MRIGNEEQELNPGDTYTIPSNVPHDAVAGPDGATVVDVFAPPREDWKKLQRAEPSPGRWP
jgi:quercetin dioxygenase-like cupin family protein